ncbi:Rossmann-like domain-containing protein [Mailhella sp.]|uniref:Rossmann-like domain-containing protein n=1 Tax=Mailhella sp. TaxID=1981029 RepID=UPI003AB351C9
MTAQNLYRRLKQELDRLVRLHHLNERPIALKSRGLSPEEAIGRTARKDYPILAGKEIMLQAQFGPAVGQAFTDAPSDFNGTLEDVLAMDPENDPYSRGLLVATLNAVMRFTGDVEHTAHCRNDDLERCAEAHAAHIRETFGAPRVTLVGYQPALTARLSREFPLRVLDMNPQFVGSERSGVTIEHGESHYRDAVLEWPDLVLCTGSTLCNGTFVNFVDIGRPVIFFGVSGAAAARVFGLSRFCPMAS